MSKINITVGKIVTWVAGVLLLFGVFGDWFSAYDEGATVFTYWDNDMDAGFILGILAILISIANVAVVIFDYVGEKKIAKLGAIGVGAAAVLTFIIALASKESYLDMGYGLIMLLIGGIAMVVGAFIDEKLGANANVSFSAGGFGAAPAKKFCPKCGSEAPNGAPFCTTCGNKLS